MKAVIITAFHEVPIRNIDSYEDLNQTVVGYLEAIPIGPTATGYLDEDGKSKKMLA